MTRDIFFLLILMIGSVLFRPSSALAASSSVDFNRDIRPLLSSRCFTCHGPDEAAREAGLRLDSRESATEFVIDRDAPGESELLARIASRDPDTRMPPPGHGEPLNEQQVAFFRQWIAAGAPYDRHWAYQPPIKSPLPLPLDRGNVINEVDSFVRSRLQERSLSPAPPADRFTLIRRVALDLTGLPPTSTEVAEFLNDDESNAYERMVDRYLASSAYGERWAAMWLDLARYADSAGYAEDLKRTIWAYRDYVIQAFNANKSFRDFTLEQIAGDLLPEVNQQTRIATAFHRNTLTNSEGGTSDEEFRSAAVVDRVNTTMTVWMGTTMACAQCHNHKYDPLTQTEYFQLFDVFNQTADNDQRDERPTLKIYQAKWLDHPQSALATNVLPETADPQENEPITTVPIMKSLPKDEERITKIHLRGSYLNTGDVVHANTPAVFPPLPDGPPNRLTFAKWLVSRDNPLTARVIVNRYWERLFGIGLVATSEDFGAQGELPSHPLLLDWLAVDLMEHNWDIRRLVKQLVMSATYRQSSQVDETAIHHDPDNRLLARGPRQRLTAEMIRDQALAVSGLLSREMYGPAAHPPQPKVGLRPAFSGQSTDWVDSTNSNRYRRALYTEWRRSSPYASLATFDMNSREVCEVRRTSTNTPLQALVTLNDPVYLEAAQGLARKILSARSRNVAWTDAMTTTFAFQECLIRPPTTNEVERLIQLLRQSREHFRQNEKAAAELAIDPLHPIRPSWDVVELASWVTLSNVLLNLDEMLMKP